MNVLVVGGAGYIGSHMVRLLQRTGHEVVTLDNLSTGFSPAVTAGKLYVGQMEDAELVDSILVNHRIDAVMHFAACALVGESVVDPAKYYRNNVVATIALLEAMRRRDVKKIVFSSTCATYGVPQTVPISEREPQQPVNPYGFTKLSRPPLTPLAGCSTTTLRHTGLGMPRCGISMPRVRARKAISVKTTTPSLI